MSEQGQPPAAASIQTGPGTGSVVTPQYTERRMIFYLVNQREIRDLSFMNAESIAFGSAGSFFLSTAIACKVGAIFADPGHISAEGKILDTFGGWVFLAITILLWGLAARALHIRSREISDIENESTQITSTLRVSATTQAEAAG